MKKRRNLYLILGVLIAMCMCYATMTFATGKNDGSSDVNESEVADFPEENKDDVLSVQMPEHDDEKSSDKANKLTDKKVPASGDTATDDVGSSGGAKGDDKVPESDDTSAVEAVTNFIDSTGFRHMFSAKCAYESKDEAVCGQDHRLNCVMILVACVLLFLAIVKGFEPLLLVPIAIGMLLSNVSILGHDPVFHSEIFINENSHINWTALANNGSLIDYLYIGVKLGIYPSLIFIGVGAMTDFGPLIANPKSLLLGAAAQLGIFVTFIGAVTIPALGFESNEAASIGIIGGADGPTAIYVTTKLAPHLLPAIAIAAYSYMALVPVIQPPIMRLLTTKKERGIVMKQLKPVSKTAKILFPIIVTAIVALLVPSATPLVGALMFGNLLRESGVTERLSKTAQNELMNIVTIFLGISVGATATATNFLNIQTLGILALGIVAFGFGTAGGVLLAKLMNLFSKNKMNPLIGSAGVSAVPMAARVSQKEGQRENPSNFLLMHAMGPNVAGVIGSAIAAGVLISMFG